jgi:nucleoside-diphosphate-sugar epimerase
MRTAILGATSQIAGDLIELMCSNGGFELYLYARKPTTVVEKLTGKSSANIKHIGDYASFNLKLEFDLLINFVGIGNPEILSKMGSDIFDITWKFDQLALDYIRTHTDCRYIFLSSGSVYGSNFQRPVTKETQAKIPINNLNHQDWYGVAKLHAESRHRSYRNLPIIDFRIFNYFSASQDIHSRFLISDMIRSIHNRTTFKTTPENIFRDYLHPSDLFNLLLSVLNSSPKNDAIDCYSLAPVDKITLLEIMQDRFGLNFEFSHEASVVHSTGTKPHYYSLNNKAAKFGYSPKLSSLDGVVRETESILKHLTAK